MCYHCYHARQGAADRQESRSSNRGGAQDSGRAEWPVGGGRAPAPLEIGVEPFTTAGELQGMAREVAGHWHRSRLRQDPLEGSPGASLSYLVDTNVLSELRKGTRGNENVRSWFSRVAEE